MRPSVGEFIGFDERVQGGQVVSGESEPERQAREDGSSRLALGSDLPRKGAVSW